jgi:hypothetical protein
MAKPQTRKERIDFLTERTIRFFDFYVAEMEAISQVLKIRLGGLASAYTGENILPREAVNVQSRVKSLTSFLRKLEKLNWPMFNHRLLRNTRLHPSYQAVPYQTAVFRRLHQRSEIHRI